MDKTKEPQYSILYDVEKRHGRSTFGIMANESWNNDPKRTLFTLARYKFVARMLEGKNNALEIGCADAFGTRLLQQTVKKTNFFSKKFRLEMCYMERCLTFLCDLILACIQSFEFSVFY